MRIPRFCRSRLAASRRCLEGLAFHVTAETKPKPSELKLIIAAAGGAVLDKPPPAKHAGQRVVIVTSGEEERKAWGPLLGRLKGQASVIRAEHLLDCVLRQKLVLDKKHLLG